MANKIELLYDYEIANRVKEEALRLLPMFRYVVTEFPAASWEDLSYTIEQYIEQKGFEGFPTEIIPVPPVVVETVLVDIPVDDVDEATEEEPDESVIDNEDEAIIEINDKQPLIVPVELAKPSKIAINVRGIMNDLGGIR